MVTWRREATKKEYKKAKKAEQRVAREEDSDGDSEFYIYFNDEESELIEEASQEGKKKVTIDDEVYKIKKGINDQFYLLPKGKD